MAATPIRSTLSSAAQAQALVTFVSAKGRVLTAAQASVIVVELALHTLQPHKSVTRKLQTLLRPHGIELQYTHAIECVSDMLGMGSWMRVKQQMLKTATEPSYRLLCMEAEPMEEAFASLSDAANKVVELMRGASADGRFAALRLQRTRERLTVGSPLTGSAVRIPSCILGKRGPAGEEYPLSAAEVSRFGERIVRAVEYGCPGWVLENALSFGGDPWANMQFVVAFGKEKRLCFGEAELFAAIEEFGVTPESAATGDWRGAHGEGALTLRWGPATGVEPAVTQLANTEERQLLGRRFAHLRSTLPDSLAIALTRFLVIPLDDSGPETVLLKRGIVARLMQEKNIDEAALARATSAPVEQIQFARDLGAADASFVPQLARALGLPGGAALAMAPTDGNVPAIKMDSGREIVRAYGRAPRRSFDSAVSAKDFHMVQEGYALLEEFEKVLDIATMAEVDAQGRLLVGHLVDGSPMTLSYLLSWLNEELERIREAGFAVMVTAWTRYDDSFGDDTPTKATSLRLVPAAELLPLAAQDADG